MSTTHTTAGNKALLLAAFDALALGNSKPFVDLMADDFCWTIKGTGAWAGTYRGKPSVRHDLFKPLFAQFATAYTNTASRFIAEGDWVVVQCKGQVQTHSGERYDNDYCYVCRFAGGLLRELIEYLDTALVDRVLQGPESALRSTAAGAHAATAA